MRTRALAPRNARNRYINELRREIIKGFPTFGRGLFIKRRPNGTIIEPRPSRGGGGGGGADPVWLP